MIELKYINHNKKILKLLQKKKRDKAIDILEQEIGANRNSGVNALILFELLMIENDEEDAIEVLEKVLPRRKLFSNEVYYDIFVKLGTLLFQREEHNKAFGFIKEAYEIRKNPNLLVIMGQIYVALDKFEQAKVIFLFLTVKKPGNDYYKSFLAYCYIQIKDEKKKEPDVYISRYKSNEDKARDILSEILQKAPDHEAANFYFAYFLYTKGMYDPSIENFEAAMRSEEFISRSCFYLGSIFLVKKKNMKAVKYFKDCVKHQVHENRFTLEARYLLANIYDYGMDYENSYKILKAIYKVDPTYKDVPARLISDNYSKVRSDYLTEYNSLSNDGFISYTKRILTLFNMSSLQRSFADGENILIYRCEIKKIGVGCSLLEDNINYRKRQDLLVLFFRLVHVRGNSLESLLTNIPFSYQAGVVVSSEQVSPMSTHYAHNKGLTVIPPSMLNRIIKQVPIK